VAGDHPVLVIISDDPRVSHRANEAMRIALGIVAGENEVAIVLTNGAVHLLDDDTDDLVDGDDIVRYRASLRKLDIPFHVDDRAIPKGPEWNGEGHRIIPATPDAIARLMSSAERFIVF
jgi:hypothetical protein